jgi:hypothetical protein
MRDWRVVLEPLVGFGDGLAFRVVEGVSVVLGRHHGLEEMNHGGKLSGGKLVEQLVGVLVIRGHLYSVPD